MPKDKVAKDYKFFRDHFYPEKEPAESSTPVKSCSTCGSKTYKIVDGKRVCSVVVASLVNKSYLFCRSLQIE
jgi:hypothetical protein